MCRLADRALAYQRTASDSRPADNRAPSRLIVGGPTSRLDLRRDSLRAGRNLVIRYCTRTPKRFMIALNARILVYAAQQRVGGL
jgi:hypothetical protein